MKENTDRGTRQIQMTLTHHFPTLEYWQTSLSEIVAPC